MGGATGFVISGPLAVATEGLRGIKMQGGKVICLYCSRFGFEGGTEWNKGSGSVECVYPMW